MAFDIGGAIGGASSGASSGASLGPWGAVGGGILGGVFGGFGSSSSKKKKEAARQAALQRQMLQEGYNDISGMYQPYMQRGLEGFSNYADTLAGNTGAFNASPYGQAYNQYTLDNTINQIEGNSAAGGSLLSGNTLKSLQENIQAIQSNDYLNRLNQYLSNNASLGNMGFNATQGLGDYRWGLAGGNVGIQSGLAGANMGNLNSQYQGLQSGIGTFMDKLPSLMSLFG